MENPTLDFSVALAKPMELVRAHEALRAHFSGAIASARARLDDERDGASRSGTTWVRSLPATGDTEISAPPSTSIKNSIEPLKPCAWQSPEQQTGGLRQLTTCCRSCFD
jgi:hypothetical protein